jgi:hypothetical protein
MIEAHVSDNLTWVYEQEEHFTFREMLEKYVPKNTWIDLGIKVVLGMPADKFITPYERMFIPDYVLLYFKDASISRSSEDIPLCKPIKTVYKAPAPNKKFNLISPNIIILLITSLVILVTVLGQVTGRHKIWVDFVVYLFLGIAGLVLTFLTFASEHPATEWNLNLIWALPTHFIFAFLILKKSWRKNLVIYHRITAIILASFLISMPMLPQSFHWLVIPLSLILLSRATKNGWFTSSRR